MDSLCAFSDCPLGRRAPFCGRLAVEHLGDRHRIQKLRDTLHDHLVDALPGRVLLNGPSGLRLPNTLNVSIKGTVGSEVLRNAPTIAVSTGSACHSGGPEPSPVLSAMDMDRARAVAAIRLSLGRGTTADNIDKATDELAAAARAASN
ncbi:aminotransferase class V [Kribbella antiqua]|uniref:Aminotransferase class V n=1 Tax=Kribbella antiqua TaxID=2512217 RepID=A0A4R2ICR0_9ACTN|nr:aminotransferase class V-fold PLP-dependent enzyme [Kribbella antiqua]TCO42351.1 aminotransferase class V [Kribbella antiqua]